MRHKHRPWLELFGAIFLVIGVLGLMVAWASYRHFR
jgi:hypothetical protein